MGMLYSLVDCVRTFLFIFPEIRPIVLCNKRCFSSIWRLSEDNAIDLSLPVWENKVSRRLVEGAMKHSL